MLQSFVALAKLVFLKGSEAGNLQDLARQLAFMEARLTLLERKFANFSPPQDSQDSSVKSIRLACNEPGLMIDRMYPVEVDDVKNPFCWIGNNGPIQIVMPVKASREMSCRLFLKPHPKVSFSLASVMVNEELAEIELIPGFDGTITLQFNVKNCASQQINVVLTGVTSITPATLGENEDDRILAARFFGAELSPL